MSNKDIQRLLAAFLMAQCVHVGVFAAVSVGEQSQVLIAGQSISVHLETGAGAVTAAAQGSTGGKKPSPATPVSDTAPETPDHKDPTPTKEAAAEHTTRDERKTLDEAQEVPLPAAHVTKTQPANLPKPKPTPKEPKPVNAAKQATATEAQPDTAKALPQREDKPRRAEAQTDRASDSNEPEGDRGAKPGSASNAAPAVAGAFAAAGAPSASTPGNAAASNYAGLVMQHLSKFRRPRAHTPGSALITFTVMASGEIDSIEISKGSGSYKFDRDAVKFVERAAPFPEPPANIATTFSVEIEGR